MDGPARQGTRGWAAARCHLTEPCALLKGGGGNKDPGEGQAENSWRLGDVRLPKAAARGASPCGAHALPERPRARPRAHRAASPQRAPGPAGCGRRDGEDTVQGPVARRSCHAHVLLGASAMLLCPQAPHSEGTHTHTGTHAHTCAHMHEHVCADRHAHSHAHICAGPHVHACSHAYTCMHMHTQTHMYAHTHTSMHTHAHTCAQVQCTYAHADAHT